MTVIKLCRDCRHVYYPFAGAYPRCVHPEVPPTELANGTRPFAEVVRDGGPCGREGRKFEPRPRRIPWSLRFARWLRKLTED